MLDELNRHQDNIRADAKRKARSQETTQYQADKYAPTREVFEEFLKGGREKFSGFGWMTHSGAKISSFRWERQEAIEAVGGQKIVVRAFTNPKHHKFGYRAGNVNQALIGIKVSLVENPDVNQELQLPPVWAILEHDPDFSFQVLDKLEDDLADIVPLVRAYLSKD